MFTLPSKRMDILQLISAIFKSWASLVISLLPLSVLSVFFSSLPMLTSQWGFIRPFHAAFYLILVVSYAIYLIPSGAIIYSAYAALRGKSTSFSAALQLSISRFLKMLLTGILLLLIMYIVLFVGKLFFNLNMWLGLVITLGLILAISPFLIPASPLVIVDDKWPFDAVTSGIRLVKNNWLSVFISVLVVSLVTVALNLLARHLGAAAVFIVSLFTLPLTLTMTVVITENLKLKN